MVHELFHLQQFAHNDRLHISARYDYERDMPVGPTNRWFVEGSAVWAETFYLRDSGISGTVHAEWLGGAQGTPFSLLSDRPLTRAYEAYVWSLYLEQERGRQAVFDTWRNLRGLFSYAEILRKINEALPFATFTDHAVRVLNAVLPGEPITPRFVDLDPSFPDNQQPPLGSLRRSEELTCSGVVIDYRDWYQSHVREVPVPAGVPRLSARYNRVRVGADVAGEVVLEISEELRGDPAARLEVLVRDLDDAGYRRQPIELTQKEHKFSNLADLYVVLTNVGWEDEDHLVVGQVRVRAAECLDPLIMQLRFRGTYSGPGVNRFTSERADIDWTAEVKIHTGPPQPTLPLGVAPEEYFYPSEGSTFRLSGASTWEACGDDGGCTWRTESFHGEGSLIEDGFRRPRIQVEDGQIRLQAEESAPVTITTREWNNSAVRRDVTWTHEREWDLDCLHGGVWWDWNTGWRRSPSRPIEGTWTDDTKSAIRFDCDEQWEPQIYPEDGSTGHATFTAHGTVQVQPPQ
jgi:hypothetical protein